MMNKGIRPWRRLVEALQGLIILGLPFLKVGGESALRFDVTSLRLHFFGVSLWMDEFFLVLIALIFFTFLVLLVTLLFGRIWCGWACPQTVIADYTRFIDRAGRKGFVYKATAYFATLGVSVIVAANLIWYFVSPYEFVGSLLSLSLGPVIWGFWIVLTSILFLNFAFLRQRFCATVCPYAKLQSVLYDSGTLLIAFDPRRREECINCMACVRTCPVGIDIRRGMNAACINCAECIDECTKIMSGKERKALIGYFFGLPGETGRILRRSVVIVGALTLASFVFLLFLAFSRTALDLTVLPNYEFTPMMTESGRVVNSYLLSIENRGKRDLEIRINVSRDETTASITPDRILLKAGEYRRLPVLVSLAKTSASMSGVAEEVEISLTPAKDDKMKVSRKAHFIFPET
jgi:cytochrome c oxidase accessory protein FixG